MFFQGQGNHMQLEGRPIRQRSNGDGFDDGRWRANGRLTWTDGAPMDGHMPGNTHIQHNNIHTVHCVHVDQPAPSQARTTTPSENCRRVARRPSSSEPPIENILRCPRRPPRAVREGRGSDQSASPQPDLGPGQYLSMRFLSSGPCKKKLLSQTPTPQSVLEPASMPMHYVRLKEGYEKTLKGIGRPRWKIFFGVW